MCELNWLFGLYCFSGNSLSGAYTEPENSYERRRKARSNDFLDRIDISVISTTTKSAANTTTTNKRKLTPKMNRIGKKHAENVWLLVLSDKLGTYILTQNMNFEIGVKWNNLKYNRLFFIFVQFFINVVSTIWIFLKYNPLIVYFSNLG